MCFNAPVSFFTFTIGTIFSLLLITHGNKKYKKENIVFGIFFIFISLIQFMDFLFWIDIKNKLGINKIVTLFGPILNVCQPMILYLIKVIYYKPDIFSLNNYNLLFTILNSLYLLYFGKMYTKFISNEQITHVENGHLKWPWLKYSNPLYYLILFGLNAFYLTNLKYSFILFVITYFFLFISWKYFNYSTGELWCFFGSFIPLIMYYLSFII